MFIMLLPTILIKVNNSFEISYQFSLNYRRNSVNFKFIPITYTIYS